MLKKIFGSGARVKLFQQFLLNPKEEFFIRELTRILDEQINSLRRELENLERIGMLKSSERNRKKYYRLNPHCPILSELTSIIRKNEKSLAALLTRASKLGGIDIMMLGGQFIGKEADVDVFIVGDVKKDDLAKFLEEEYPENDYKFTVMPREDFLYRMTLKDKFVKTLFDEKENIILKNKLKKDTEPLFAL
jgi:DNA-binding transcriptional ArsR family regulator